MSISGHNCIQLITTLVQKYYDIVLLYVTAMPLTSTSFYGLDQWFLTWVPSVSQFQGFGGLVHPARLCTNTVYSYIHMFRI